MIPKDLVRQLWCPTCRRGGLTSTCAVREEQLTDGSLRCESCGVDYPVQGGLPDLRPRTEAGSAAWVTWEAHLEALERRRTLRNTRPSAAQSRRWGHKTQAFAAFVAPRVSPGPLLDVGCGPGNLRRALDSSRLTYHGLDPIPLPETREFPFALGLAEAIPFRDRTFAALVVRSALDHLLDLQVFFREASRVLRSDGHLFLEQVVHDDPGIAGLVQHGLHATKDWIDDRRTRGGQGSAPKHMREFSRASLQEATREQFRTEDVQAYRPHWYTPTQMFVHLRPGARG